MSHRKKFEIPHQYSLYDSKNDTRREVEFTNEATVEDHPNGLCLLFTDSAYCHAMLRIHANWPDRPSQISDEQEFIAIESRTHRRQA